MRRPSMKTISLLLISILIIGSVLVIFTRKQAEPAEEDQPQPTAEKLENTEPIFSLKAKEIRHITIENGEETIALAPESPYSDEEVRTNLSGWYMHQPFQNVYSVKYNPLVDILYSVEEVQWQKLEDKSGSDEDWEKPSLLITFQTEEQEETLALGGQAGEGKRYAKRMDTGEIGIIVESDVQPYQLKSFQLVEKFVKIIAIDVLDQLTIDFNNQETVIQIDHQKKDEPAFYINDQKIEEDTFRNLYKEIAGLSVTNVVTDAEYHTPEATMTYTLINQDEQKAKKVKVELVSYNDHTFAVFLNGKADFLLEKSAFKKMLKKIKQA